jgi:hypothetical protein
MRLNRPRSIREPRNFAPSSHELLQGALHACVEEGVSSRRQLLARAPETLKQNQNFENNAILYNCPDLYHADAIHPTILKSSPIVPHKYEQQSIFFVRT